MINKIENNINNKNKLLFVNKYQPNYFNDFEINDEIIILLKTLIKLNNLNILFIGNNSSGKTSFINALIKEYYLDSNTLHSNYNDNILHINSLKDQGINYYKNDLKTFCQTCSSIKNKKKIIVLDDIDLINEQSQQVFCNYIDKYNKNVHFIASCNNTQKVIESIQSRLNIIQIKSLTKQNLFNIMEKIKQSENITIDKDAEEFILNICNNTAKILINYMEKFKLLDEHITFDIVNNICTHISFISFNDYTNYLKNNNSIEAIKVLYKIYDKGYSVMDILDNYFFYIKNTNILTEEQKYDIIPYICKYITIFHNIHEDEIELTLFTNNLLKIIKN
jgi:replication factor C small subunit